MFTVEQASRLYRVPTIDYGRPEATGLLIASGCGLMMSVMDAVSGLRWCVDFDALKPDASLDSFLTVAAPGLSVIGMCGWFTITKPETIRSVTSREDVIVYGGNVRFGARREATSLRDFVTLLTESVAFLKSPQEWWLTDV